MPQLALAVAAAEVAGSVAAAYGVAAGSVVAFGMTAAQIGFAVGSVAGSILFSPTQKASGPRLADLKAPQVTYGSTIAYIEGHPRLAGTLVWASEKREISTTTQQGGKGGGGAEVTSFTYEIDVMVMLSENVAAALRRVWWNGDLVYTRAEDADLASLQSEEERWERLTFYSGAADQLPDPTYEAAVGVGNAPAYRGRSCVFIESLQLGSGGQLPNLTFEVSGGDAGTLSTPASVIWTLPANSTYVTAPPQGAYQPSGPTVAISTYGPGVDVDVNEGATTSLSLPVGAFAGSPANGNSSVALVGFGPVTGVPYLYLRGDGLNLSIAIPDATDYLGKSEMRFSYQAGLIVVGSSLALAAGAGVFSGCTGFQGDLYVFDSAGVHQHTIAHGASVSSVTATTGFVYALSGSTLSSYETTGWTLAGTIALPAGSGHRVFTSSDGYLCCANADGEIYQYQSGAWSLFATMFDDTVDLGTGNAVHFASETKAYASVLDVTAGPNINDERWVWSGYDPTTADPSLFFVELDGSVDQYGQFWATTFTNSLGEPRATRGFYWEETSRATVSIPHSPYVYIEEVHATLHIERYYGYALDTDPPGFYATSTTTFFYRFVYRVTPQSVRTLVTYRAWSADLVPLTEPTLQDVVERQCERAGLDLALVDASELATRNVHSMVISQISSPRAVIEMLASAYFFSSVESEILRFSFRGADPRGQHRIRRAGGRRG
jgi:hypothetical protein